MTAPEQKDRWRAEFESQLLPATEMTKDVFGKYCLSGLETQWQGFLRDKQTIKRLLDILEVVENRFTLTPSDRGFLKSFRLRKG